MNDFRKNRSKVYLGVAWVIFGLVILYLSMGESGIPSRVALVSATGSVQSVTKGKSSVKFSLNGDAHHFQHLPKSGKLLPVYQALSGAKGEMVTALFDPAQNWQPVFNENSYHTVYEIRISDRTLLSYEQASEAWQTDQHVGNWLGMAFVFTCVALIVFARFR